MSLVIARDLALPGRLASTALGLEGGMLTALIGPNGSGKTSLLHALARIGDAAGQVMVGGQDLDRLSPKQRGRALAFLPASRELGWPIVAREVIALSGARDSEVAQMVRLLELESVAGRRADQLSTGERSRILIARALANQPTLVLLDEPTANLDPLWQIQMMELLREEIAGSERAAIVAMHDLDAAALYADRLIVMDGGRIAADGGPEEVLRSKVIPAVFGIERGEAGWRPVNPQDRRSSR